MIKLFISAGCCFSLLYAIDTFIFPMKEPAKPSPTQISTQQLIDAVSAATGADGTVTAPAIMGNLQEGSSQTPSTKSLEDLVSAVLACEKEGKLTAENFTQKFSGQN